LKDFDVKIDEKLKDKLSIAFESHEFTQ